MIYKHNSLRKIALVILMIAVAIPAFFFGQPKKADAQVSCLMSMLGMTGIASMIGDIMAVPVRSVSITTNTGLTSAATTGNNISECIIKPMVKGIIKSLLHNFTNSVVDWINSGFHGSPSFVSNPEGFFANVGDIAAGQFLEGLGPIGQILCSPFDLQLRIALGLSAGGGRRFEYYGCRLTDVQKNIYNAFTGGQWGSNGWSNWIAVTQPQNNAYGAYLYAQDEMSRRIANKVGLRQQELNWGSGFLGNETCYDETGAEISDSQLSAAEMNGENIRCQTNTPGSVIQTQLNKALGSEQDFLQVADDFNAIVGALVNQAINQVFSATGLLGTNKGSSYYGGRSYLQSTVQSYQSQLASAQTLPPEGIDCAKTYRVSPDRWVDVLNGTAFASTVPAIIVPAGKTPAEFQNQIKLGCQNLAMSSSASQAISGLVSTPGLGLTPTGDSGSETIQDTNVAPGKNATQSSTYQLRTTGAERAINGNTSTKQLAFKVGGITGTGIKDPPGCWMQDITNMCGSETQNLPNSYWQVDLGKNHNIHKIIIDQPYGDGWSNLGIASAGSEITVQVLDSISPEHNVVGSPIIRCSKGSTDATFCDDAGGAIALKLENLNLVGRYVKIQKEFGALALGQVQIFGAPVTGDSGSGSSGPTHSDIQITSTDPSGAGGGTAIILSTTPTQSSSFDNNGNLTVSSDATMKDITAKINLYRVTNSGAETTIDLDGNGAVDNDGLPRMFSNFKIYRSFDPNESTPANLEQLYADAPSWQTLTQNGLPILKPSNNKTLYYLKIVGTFFTPASFFSDSNKSLIGKTYKLVVELFETVSKLPVGTQTYTFTIKSPYAP